MKYYSKFGYLLLPAIFLLSFGITAQAQKRRAPRRSTSASSSNKPAAKTKANNVANSAVIKDEAQIVSNQVKNLAQFIFVYGGSLTRIQMLDQDAKLGKLSASARKQSEGGKQGLILTIRTFKNAMIKLEDDFRKNPALRPFLLQLTGVGETAATADEQAVAGQFEQAGRTLLEVLNQLTDTLQAMP